MSDALQLARAVLVCASDRLYLSNYIYVVNTRLHTAFALKFSKRIFALKFAAHSQRIPRK